MKLQTRTKAARIRPQEEHTFALREADLTGFTADEIALLSNRPPTDHDLRRCRTASRRAAAALAGRGELVRADA